jgi:hypothetical protein
MTISRTTPPLPRTGAGTRPRESAQSKQADSQSEVPSVRDGVSWPCWLGVKRAAVAYLLFVGVDGRVLRDLFQHGGIHRGFVGYGGPLPLDESTCNVLGWAMSAAAATDDRWKVPDTTTQVPLAVTVDGVLVDGVPRDEVSARQEQLSDALCVPGQGRQEVSFALDHFASLTNVKFDGQDGKGLRRFIDGKEAGVALIEYAAAFGELDRAQSVPTMLLVHSDAWVKGPLRNRDELIGEFLGRGFLVATDPADSITIVAPPLPGVRAILEKHAAKGEVELLLPSDDSAQQFLDSRGKDWGGPVGTIRDPKHVRSWYVGLFGGLAVIGIGGGFLLRQAATIAASAGSSRQPDTKATVARPARTLKKPTIRKPQVPPTRAKPRAESKAFKPESKERPNVNLAPRLGSAPKARAPVNPVEKICADMDAALDFTTVRDRQIPLQKMGKEMRSALQEGRVAEAGNAMLTLVKRSDINEIGRNLEALGVSFADVVKSVEQAAEQAPQDSRTALLRLSKKLKEKMPSVDYLAPSGEDYPDSKAAMQGSTQHETKAPPTFTSRPALRAPVRAEHCRHLNELRAFAATMVSLGMAERAKDQYFIPSAAKTPHIHVGTKSVTYKSVSGKHSYLFDKQVNPNPSVMASLRPMLDPTSMREMALLLDYMEGGDVDLQQALRDSKSSSGDEP